MRKIHLRLSVFAILVFYAPGTLLAQNESPVIAATTEFLVTLSPEQTRSTVFDFNDSARQKWTNLPVGMVPRSGIQYGSLSDQSRMAFHRVLVTLLSSQGYLKATSIMQLDDILNTLYQQAYDKGELKKEQFQMIQNLNWGHGNYYIAVWGKPQGRDPWGLSFGGHHLALCFTQKGDQISMSPLFIGTDPSEVKSSKYAGWRVLSKEEDYGFLLVNGLTENQRTRAVLKDAVPSDIITNPKSSQRITDYYGIPASELNDNQKAMLELLMEEYVHNFEHPVAHKLMEKVRKTGLDKIYFAWVGSLHRDSPHYYIIHGPDILIEYDNMGFQKDGNHIHAILRESGNDFGADILKQHYLNSEHHR